MIDNKAQLDNGSWFVTILTAVTVTVILIFVITDVPKQLFTMIRWTFSQPPGALLGSAIPVVVLFALVIYTMKYVPWSGGMP